MSYNYSQAAIINLALNRIGARGQITDINENSYGNLSPNAQKAMIVWNPIFLEVLSERDWKFAKIRAQLQLMPTVPLYGFSFAWALPADFLRFVRPRPKKYDENYMWYNYGGCEGWYHRRNTPFFPHVDYITETLPGICTFTGTINGNVLTASMLTGGTINVGQPLFGVGITQGTFITAWGTGTGTAGTYSLNNSFTITTPESMTVTDPTSSTAKCVLTNYGGNLGTGYGGYCGPAMINYIRIITDYTQLMPGFVNCLANRLAAELAIGITEDKQKAAGYMEAYRESMNSAEAQNETLDYSYDESGSSTWLRAGRTIGYGGWGGGYGGGY